MALPESQPGRLTSSWASWVRSGVRCATPRAPVVDQAGRGEVAAAEVRARDETFLLVIVKVAGLSAACAWILTEAAAVLDLVGLELNRGGCDLGALRHGDAGKRRPTVCTFEPSVTISRSLLGGLPTRSATPRRRHCQRRPWTWPCPRWPCPAGARGPSRCHSRSARCPWRSAAGRSRRDRERRRRARRVRVGERGGARFRSPRLQVTARALPAGRASSDTVPANEAGAGRVTLYVGARRSTVGARLTEAEPPDSTAPTSGADPEKLVTWTATSPLGSA